MVSREPPSLESQSFVFFSGLESTFMPHADKDVLETTRHTEFVERDLSLVADMGMRYLRYSAPWHRIEAEQGRYNWSWMDRAMEALAQRGITPIADLVHHTSFPLWLREGFAEPDFPERLAEFAGAFAERYPWVRWYTVFNEPFITTILCGVDGVWYPNHKGGDRTWVPMLLNACRSICLGQDAVLQKNPKARFMHVDTCEHHHSLNPIHDDRVQNLNERRFVAHDLVRGRVNPAHSQWGWLRENGLSDAVADFFAKNPANTDLLGLDYYAHSELGHGKKQLEVPTRRALGFAAVAREYQERYETPALLSETNVRGSVQDRVTWLRHMLHQCELCARDERPLWGFCWYPFIDSCDWDSLLRDPRNHVDPQGLYCLGAERDKRHPSILTEAYTRLVRGEWTWQDLPYYHFSAECLGWVCHHVKLMSGPEWQDWKSQ